MMFWCACNRRQHRLRNVRRLIEFLRSRSKEVQEQNLDEKPGSSIRSVAGDGESGRGVFDRNRGRGDAR